MKIIDEIFNPKKIAKRFSITYIFSGILFIIVIDKLLQSYFELNASTDYNPKYLSIFFIIITGFIIYIIINHLQKLLKTIDKAYEDLKEKEKDRLAPYEFALDNSVDAIHWFNMEGKFVYVNNATCQLDGYSKEEFNNLYLEDIDPKFNRTTAIECMEQIKSTPNWRIESTHKKKDGTIYPVEVSGHSIYYNGLEYICAFARDMTQRLEYRNKLTTMNIELQKSLKEKDILLKEIHHRVKNNMEIISSMLNMQMYKYDDKRFKELMIESRSKIHAMALVHEFLYLGDDLSSINVNDYIERLLDDTKDLYISQDTHLDIDLHVHKIEFSINRCIQIGMLLHELCVNAFKYAFKQNKKNLLCLHMKVIDGNIHLQIRDNGKGLKNIDELKKSESIGMQLIHSIVGFQLYGTIEFKNNNGLECNIIFPIKESE
ncbi:MAG: histidine kinase [Arcobacter sp.]|nr:histidine kinase [Arcobacter sp.]|tara:strand:- start:13486 stop:14775 length:1290 start_codon:yes stop_codon:yes gene_type:complete